MAAFRTRAKDKDKMEVEGKKITELRIILCFVLASKTRRAGSREGQGVWESKD